MANHKRSMQCDVNIIKNLHTSPIKKPTKKNFENSRNLSLSVSKLILLIVLFYETTSTKNREGTIKAFRLTRIFVAVNAVVGVVDEVNSCLSAVDGAVITCPFELAFVVAVAFNFVNAFVSFSFGGFIFRCWRFFTAKLLGLVIVVGVTDGVFVVAATIVAASGPVDETIVAELALGRPRVGVGTPDVL